MACVTETIVHVPLSPAGFDPLEGKVLHSEIEEEPCECGYLFSYDYKDSAFVVEEVRKVGE